MISGRGAVWLARLTGGQKVAGSNPVAPTSEAVNPKGFAAFVLGPRIGQKSPVLPRCYLSERHLDPHPRRRTIAERECPAGPEPVKAETPLAAVGLPVRMVNLLEDFDIRSVADLDDTTDTQLRRLPYLGTASVRMIRRTVRQARRKSHQTAAGDS